uniref:Uncharacterized protein n=1 Tax=Anguilla anguilla TaxID=7936 RepID=A0A0E9QSW6_ANGAN
MDHPPAFCRYFYFSIEMPLE